MTIYLTDYKTFDNKHDLNESVAAHLSKNKLNKTQRDVLWMLSQYSVKYYGASHLKTKTIANHVGKSIRTIRRVIDVLEELNIIRRINTRRMKGGKGANIYQIMPYQNRPQQPKNNNDTSNLSPSQNAVKPITEPIVTTSVQTEPIIYKAKSSITDDTRKNKQNEKLKSSLLAKLPETIAKTLGVFFDDFRDIYRAYGTMLKAKAGSPLEVDFEQDELRFNKVLLDTIRGSRMGKIKDFHAYLYTSVKRTATQVALLSYQY